MNTCLSVRQNKTASGGEILEKLTVFLFGAAAYCAIEILWRGYTHWTMAVAGGLCFFIIYFENTKLKNAHFLLRCAVGAASITAVELAIGIVVNIILGWNVWDYSAMPLNFLGQICLPYALLWFALCIPILFICDFARKILKKI